MSAFQAISAEEGSRAAGRIRRRSQSHPSSKSSRPGPRAAAGPRRAAAGSQTGRVAAAFSAFATKAARLTAIGAQRWPGPAKKAFELEVAADAGLSGAESASLAAVQNYATA